MRHSWSSDVGLYEHENNYVYLRKTGRFPAFNSARPAHLTHPIKAQIAVSLFQNPGHTMVNSVPF